MTLEPLVSIVLPTYNGARYLAQSVQSCLTQTYSNWELVIVDDASTDETPTIIKQYAALDPRIHATSHSSNRKLPAALNTGFKIARGDYLTWTSDDNCYRPDALSVMVHFLTFRPEIQMVYANYTEIDENSQHIRSVSVGEPTDLVKYNCIGPCFMYRRIVYEELGGYAENLFLVEDYDYWLRVSSRFALSPLREDLYFFRRHDASLTTQRIQHVKVVAEKALAQNLLCLPWLSGQDRAAVYVSLSQKAYARGDLGATRTHLFHALQHSPHLVLRKVSKRFLVSVLGGSKVAHALSKVAARLRP